LDYFFFSENTLKSTGSGQKNAKLKARAQLGLLFLLSLATYQSNTIPEIMKATVILFVDFV